MVESAPRHTLIVGAVEALDCGQSPVLLDGDQSCGPVVQIARQHHTDDSSAIAMSSGTEERVDGGPVAVLLRSPGEANVSVIQMKVPIGRGNVNSPRLDWLPIPGVPRGNRARSSENAG